MEGFAETLHARAWPVDMNARLVVVTSEVTAGWPSDTDAQLEATIGEDVDRDRFFGENRRIPEVDREHVGTDPQCRRGVGCGQQRGQRRGGVPHVVTHEEHVVAERLRLAGGFLPLGAGAAQTR